MREWQAVMLAVLGGIAFFGFLFLGAPALLDWHQERQWAAFLKANGCEAGTSRVDRFSIRPRMERYYTCRDGAQFWH